MKMGIPMVTTTYKGVTLSAHAVRNGAPMPVHSAPVIRGDFAAGSAGKARRIERRDARSAKRSFLASC
jgi:hypothetical protein